MSESIFSLSGFGVAFGERIILSAVDLQVADRQVTTLVGPSGTGKSTLLRSIAGFNDTNPSFRTWGSAVFAGLPLGDDDRPAMVSQSARLMMASVHENIVHYLHERHLLTPLQQRELTQRILASAGLDELIAELDEPVVRLPLHLQRHLAIARLAAAGPRMICIDEPTTGLGDDEAERLLDYIARESAQRAMLVVLHNQKQARRLGGTTALLAGGVIQETQTTEAFFSQPKTSAGESFARTGSCSVAAPDSKPEDLAPDVPPPAPVPAEARQYVSDSFGPRGFLWLKKGQLAGTPRPGIFYDIDYDLKALSRVGVSQLISLTQTPPDKECYAENSIGNVWLPIPDMGAPSVTEAFGLCQQIEKMIAGDEVVAVHCRAGLGRTGTLLAAYLIWEGQGALEALETVRKVEPRWVQSDTQVQFLEEFAQAVASRTVTPRTAQHAAP